MESAQTDIREIHKYISEDLQNPNVAVRRIKDIEIAIRSLDKFPARFSLVSDSYLSTKGFRMLPVKTHLVFFIIREDVKAVSVIRVIYARRDWTRMLKVDGDRLPGEESTRNTIL
jgi:plasmid stabilization system protein ParE